MTNERPADATAEEIAEYEVWVEEWNRLTDLGWERYWLTKYGYEDDPEPLRPEHRQSEAQSRWDQDKWARERAAERAAEIKLIEKADKAAEAARQRVLRSRK